MLFTLKTEPQNNVMTKENSETLSYLRPPQFEKPLLFEHFLESLHCQYILVYIFSL